MALTLKLNGETHTVDAEPGTPLLWVIRDELKLTGTKFGCGVASCGACTVHLNGEPVRARAKPISKTLKMPRSPQSKRLAKTRSAPPCNRHGSSWTWSSAAIASRAK